MKRSKPHLTIALVLLAGASAAGAQDARPTFELRGQRFGDELPKKDRSCSPDKSIPGTHHCYTLMPGEIAGVEIGDVISSYLDGRLYGVSYRFAEFGYDPLAAALETKYGQPDSVFATRLQNRMGANFVNETKLWRFADGMMMISRYGAKLTEGRIEATHYEGLKAWAARQKIADREAALRDLGPPAKK